jgi:hypothetical protein
MRKTRTDRYYDWMKMQRQKDIEQQEQRESFRKELAGIQSV